MTPIEIQQLTQSSPTLEAALTMQKAHVWQFLRQEVLPCGVAPCPRCTRACTLLVSPYAQDLCITCLLDELLIGGPILPEDKYYDPRSRTYNAEYATWEPSNIPDDYDDPEEYAWS
jgi:hypothetical protein